VKENWAVTKSHLKEVKTTLEVTYSA
jgi:hypothetical protein